MKKRVIRSLTNDFFTFLIMTACVASTPTDEENNTEISEAYDNKVKKYHGKSRATDVEKIYLGLLV